MKQCQSCDRPTIGNSKYCAEHRAIARSKWLEMIQAQKTERELRNNQWQQLYNDAITSGNLAAQETVPIPMTVCEHKNMLDDNSPIIKSYHVSEGVCGFAWVVIRPGTCSFARWITQNGLGDKDYYGGIAIYPKLKTQSIERKMAWASAVCQVLRTAGINVSSRSRED